MTTSHTTVDNTADVWSTVGIQAQYVNNSTAYVVNTDASPRTKYDAGVRYLEDGVRTKAKELIDDAIAHGHDSGEVRFHLLLAMLSKRSRRQLSPSELQQLSSLRESVEHCADDEWKRGSRTICDLVDCSDDPATDPGPVHKELLELQADQRAKILKHLDLFLAGSVKDELWAERRDAAKNGRTSNDRLNRVWAYFCPDPIGPRAKPPDPVYTTARDRLVAVTATALLVLACGYLGWLVLHNAAPIPVLAYVLAVAAGYVGARCGLEWRYRAQRLRDTERTVSRTWRVNQAPEGGFANRIDQLFDYYFAKYVPKDVDRQRWLADTAGFRNLLRDEVVDLYREARVPETKVRWLVRYLVSDVRNRWNKATLFDHRTRYQTQPTIKLWCCVGIATMVPTVGTVVDAAIRSSPLTASAATFVAVVGGWIAAHRWLHIHMERRRYAEEQQRHHQCIAERHDAYERWQTKLKRLRPAEAEMEAWLEHDKIMLLDDAIRRYKLTWGDVVAHTFLQTPAQRYKRTRARNGPWRYSRYDIRLFLITDDGVRVVSTELDFERATFHGQQRTNFRFDAVTSIDVTRTEQLHHTLDLTLASGPTMSVSVTDPDPSHLEPDESPGALTEITLEATGFAHTLYLLEGIAAEGKQWIARMPRPTVRLDHISEGLLT